MPTLPPGPKIAPLQSFRYMQDPYGYYRRVQARYGDPVTIPSMNGTLVVTGHPEGIRDIFAAHPDSFAPWGAATAEPLVGRQSLLLQGEPTHMARRRLLMPPFHGERMHTYGRIFQTTARRHADRLRLGQRFVMQHLAADIAIEVIVRAVFGVSDPAEAERWSQDLQVLLERVPLAALFFPFLRIEIGGWSPWSRYRRRQDDVHARIAAMLAVRRRGDEGGEDILSLLLQARFDDGGAMSDDELRDQLMTLLFAGHETTSSALAWAMYWLGRHPEVRERLMVEITALGADPDPMAVARLPFLDAVCHEVLRLHPIVPDLPRQLVKPLTLRGYDLPAGVAVSAVVALVHADATLYPEPEAFRPGRFLERTYGPFEFIPFGGGARRCIGSAFALYEMKVVLATLLSGYTFHLADDRPIVPSRRNITMGPQGGVPLVLAG